MTDKSLKHQAIINRINPNDVPIDKELVSKAIDFCIKYHGNQKRASGELYYHHPLEVAEIVATVHIDTETIVTAILHDTIEDTELTLEEIARNFSPKIAELVDGVTKLTKLRFEQREVRESENLRKFFLRMSHDLRVLVVKLADRIHNMRTIHFFRNQKKKERIARETIEIYAPLAERIGIQQLKVELQDIAFSILYPKIRDSIINRLEQLEKEYKETFNKILQKITNLMEINSVDAIVCGRKKTPYSTWMKMKQKDVAIDELSDILGFRIIINSTQIIDCYHVLGLIHNKYKMITNSLQDYISTPKDNGYQSLHTVVFGPLKQKIEIQIRTKQMHDIAEFGIAAHWRYKQGYYKNPDDTKKYRWIQELLGSLQSSITASDFLRNTRLTMYYNEIFCFTPKGHIISLPKGATVLDFAYKVHSTVGNHCIGAKINNRIVPISSKVSNGDNVEIMVSHTNSISPTWEQFVVTGKARAGIRKLILQKEIEEYLLLGRKIMHYTSQIYNIANENEAEILSNAALYFEQTVDELLLDIGNGTLTNVEVLRAGLASHNLFYDLLRSIKRYILCQWFDKTSQYSLSISNLVADMAIHHAKCCKPLYGDLIIGILSPGHGMTVHTIDCIMMQYYNGSRHRRINLNWQDDNIKSYFMTKITVSLMNVLSSLSSVCNQITDAGGNISNFQIIHRDTEYFRIVFDIKLASFEAEDQMLNALNDNSLVNFVEKNKFF